jgi:hypothetical protein
VVDFGDVPGEGARPGGVEARCVPVDGDTTGGDVLKAAGFTLRVQGGMVCAINGYPADGCGKQTGQRRYLYWSYWRADAGSGAWEYSSIGPAYARAGDGDVDGWRFVDGSGSPNDPQPRQAPDHLAICGPPTADPPADAPAGAFPAGGAADVANAPPDAAAPGTDLPSGAPADASTGVDDASAASTPSPNSSSGASADASADNGDGGVDDLALAEASSSQAADGRGGMIGALVVAALVVALGGGAFLRSRAR